MLAQHGLKRKLVPSSGAMPPPPALRRNYTVCGLLHDRTEEERDNQLADILGYKFAVVDARSGAILECAEALAETIGVPQHRLCGERLADWLEDGAARARLEAALASGEALSEMVRLRGADGAPGVLGELNLPVDSVCLADAARWRLCLLVESPTEAAELQLQRLATCLRLPMPVAPRLRETLGRLQRTFIVTDPNLDDNPIVFASEVRRSCPRGGEGPIPPYLAPPPRGWHAQPPLTNPRLAPLPAPSARPSAR